MQEINELLKKYQLKPKKYIKKNSVIYIETNKGKYIIKKKTNKNNDIYEYLKTRNFDYIPKIISDKNEQYEITKYIEEYNIPKEQKIIDMIELIALLHNKTTHYKEVTEDNYKETYEDINNNIEHLYGYYNDLITIIESKIYMSPSQYLLARNITKIFQTLNFTHKELEEWYKTIKEKKRQRFVVLHNNLDIEHYISNEKRYLISWDKSKIGIPIFDLYKLYIKHGLEYDFNEIFKIYQKNYPLTEEEKKLFFILILLPKKLQLNKSEYENTKEVGKMIDYLYKTEAFISPYYSDKRPKNN